MIMESFYNTTNESGTQLEMFTQKASTQEEKIMIIFKEKYRLTADQCFNFYRARHEGNTPITSIRRAMTNLTSKGKLDMTSDKEVGGYGRDNYYYKLR